MVTLDRLGDFEWIEFGVKELEKRWGKINLTQPGLVFYRAFLVLCFVCCSLLFVLEKHACSFSFNWFYYYRSLVLIVLFS
jgi:hypothetical protein